jgi:hypothetical protein
MKKIFLTLAILSGIITSAQVKIGDNVTTLNANSVLELESANKGVLFPRVALTSTTSFSPLAAHVVAMVVYNTATTSDVTPGLYTNNGTIWVKNEAVTTSLVKNYIATEIATSLAINGNQVYAIKGEFTTLGTNALVTIAKPTGMTGYYKITTYLNGTTFRSDISSFNIDPLVTSNNVITGNGLFSEIYPAGTYTYTLEYFK